MATYRIFKHSSGEIFAIKLGWSWPAFLFGFIWALYRRLTLIGFSTIAAWTTFIVIQEHYWPSLENETIMIISFLINFVYGSYGNQWISNKLISKGYSPTDKFIKKGITRELSIRFPRIKKLWSDSVWSKVIATMIVAGAAYPANYIWSLMRDPKDSSDEAFKNLVTTAQTSRSLLLKGHIEPNGTDTYAWFEWGETPALGNYTRRQLIKQNVQKEFIHEHIVGLKENTTYYYKLLAYNQYGNLEGKVVAVTTSPIR